MSHIRMSYMNPYSLVPARVPHLKIVPRLISPKRDAGAGRYRRHVAFMHDANCL